MDNIASFLEILTENSLYRRILTQSSKIYSIKCMKLQTISPGQVYQHFQKLQQKQKEQKKKELTDDPTLQPDTWNNNQLKLFAWISVCYSHLKQKGFSQFDKRDFEFFKELFPRKSQEFFSYNLKVLYKKASIRRTKWSQEEVELFELIMKQHSGEYKWTQISFQLFSWSNGLYFQIPQQCREQWINHLNPVVKKDRWTLAQDILLLQSVVREGKRWSSISKMFDGSRTEHMVKNRYRSIIHKNESKGKKISEVKLCENILLYLEHSLNQMQSTQNLKNPQSSQDSMQNEVLLQQDQVEFVQMTAFKDLIRLQTETEPSIDPIKQCFEQINIEDVSVSSNGIKIQRSGVVELMQVQEQNIRKTSQEIFIESLLF